MRECVSENVGMGRPKRLYWHLYYVPGYNFPGLIGRHSSDFDTSPHFANFHICTLSSAWARSLMR